MVTKLAELNKYTINISQELIALGVINVFSPSLGGYLTMGLFSSSRSLLIAGSQSQLAGVFTAFMLIIALYFLMGAFVFTPLRSLAGIRCLLDPFID
ncbi:sulfate transporter [Trichoderma sp. SZMC 28014]